MIQPRSSPVILLTALGHFLFSFPTYIAATAKWRCKNTPQWWVYTRKNVLLLHLETSVYFDGNRTSSQVIPVLFSDPYRLRLGQLPCRLASAHHCLLSPNQTPWGLESEYMIPAKRSPGSSGGHRQVKGEHSRGQAEDWKHTEVRHFLGKGQQVSQGDQRSSQVSQVQTRWRGRVFQAESSIHKAAKVQQIQTQNDWNEEGGRWWELSQEKQEKSSS